MFHYRGLKNIKGEILPSKPAENLRETRVIGLRSMIFMMGGIGLLISVRDLLPVFHNGIDLAVLLRSIVGLFFFLACLIAFRSGKLVLASWFAVFTIFSAFCLDLFLSGKINQFSFYGFFVLAFLAGMVLTQFQSVVLISLLVLVGFSSFLISRLGSLSFFSPSIEIGADVIIHTLLFVVSALIGGVLGRELDQAFDRSEKLSQQFKAIFNQSTDAIFITDLNFNILELNQQAAELVDQPAETVVGKRILDFSPKGIEKQINELVSDILVNGKISNILLPFINQDGADQFLQISANLIFQETGKPDHIQVILRDITERKIVEDRIQRLAMKDHLTKVDNRLSLTYRLNSLIAKMNRDGGSFALVYFDMDNFKAVNDRYGHFIGDQLLVAFTKRLQGTIRSSDFLARMGGDEFVLILENYESISDLESALERINGSLHNPFKIGEHLIYLETSYGISCYPEDGSEAGELLKQADSAMYTRKRI